MAKVVKISKLVNTKSLFAWKRLVIRFLSTCFTACVKGLLYDSVELIDDIKAGVFSEDFGDYNTFGGLVVF